MIKLLHAVWVSLAITVLSAGLAHGQTETAPAIEPVPVLDSPSSADTTSAVDSETQPPRPLRLGVFGDSLADGLWAGLNSRLRRDERFESVDQLSEVSTGLANWVYRDIEAKTADQLQDAQYDIAVVMFGSNDMQGIRDGEGRVHRFRSDSWEAVYRERARIVMGQLHDHGAQVIWVGLPIMRSAGYDANVRHLNAIFREEAEAAGAVFVSSRAASADPEGAYSGYLEENGIPRLMRADDGIHFTMRGYRRLALPVVQTLEAVIEDPELGRPEPTEENVLAAHGLVEQIINDELYLCAPTSDGTLQTLFGLPLAQTRETVEAVPAASPASAAQD